MKKERYDRVSKEWYEKGKKEAISNFAEKIKEDLIKCGCQMCQDEIERIDKLVEEQSSGEGK